MRLPIIAVLSIGGLLAATSPLFAQAAAYPGTQGTEPLSRNGAGPDSLITGTSESGRGGTGGSGGILDNGTSDNAGTATGGNSGGRGQSGSGG